MTGIPSSDVNVQGTATGLEVLDPAVVHLGHLAAWMSEHGLEDGPISDVSLIAGGTQNVLLRFRRAGVVQRP